MNTIENQTQADNMPCSATRTQYIGRYIRPNGYNGHKLVAYMLLDGRKICYAWADGKGNKKMTGYLSADVPDCLDVEEAKWLLEKHPRSIFKKFV